MTKEEAIRILDPETTKEELVGIKGYAAMMKVVDEACILAVAALREQLERRWIPVTERLPDKWRETDEKYFGEPIEFIVHIAGAECATTLCFDGKDFFDINTGEFYMVTHWMPLPEPPKEDV